MKILLMAVLTAALMAGVAQAADYRLVDGAGNVVMPDRRTARPSTCTTWPTENS